MNNLCAHGLWFEIKNPAENIELGESVIMPNHVYGICGMVGMVGSVGSVGIGLVDGMVGGRTVGSVGIGLVDGMVGGRTVGSVGRVGMIGK